LHIVTRIAGAIVNFSIEAYTVEYVATSFSLKND